MKIKREENKVDCKNNGYEKFGGPLLETAIRLKFNGSP